MDIAVLAISTLYRVHEHRSAIENPRIFYVCSYKHGEGTY